MPAPTVTTMTSARSGSVLAAVTSDLARNPVLSLSLPATAGVGTALMLGSAFWIGLLLVLFGLGAFAALVATSAAGALDWHGPQEWQRMRGTHPDQQQHSPEA